MNKIVTIVVAIIYLFACSHTNPSLINSSSKGNLAEIKNFIQSGENIDEQDDYGYKRTPLMQAIANNKMEAAKYLIKNGANVKIKDASGFDALIIASQMGNDGLEIIDLLLDRGADINSKDLNGWTPLMHTIGVNNSLKTARLLMKRGANLQVKDPATGKSLDSLALYYRQPGLAAEFKEAMTKGINVVYDAKIVFIRESNPLMLANYYIDIEINDRLINMNMSKAGSDYIDILAGKHDIIIKGPSFAGAYKITLDAQAGKTYYYELRRRAGNVVAAVFGSVIGMAIEAAASGDKAGPVEIIPLEESIAIEKLKALQSLTK